MLTIAASIGIAACPADGVSPGELLEAADRGLYRAKHGGGAQHARRDARRARGSHRAPPGEPVIRLVPDDDGKFVVTTPGALDDETATSKAKGKL
jgi:hypothetical protein